MILRDHADARLGSELSETLNGIDRRLLRGIVNPAMAAVWPMDLLLADRREHGISPWLRAKRALALALLAFHGCLAVLVSTLAEHDSPRAARFYRVVNDVPTVLTIAIVVLVAFKPFSANAPRFLQKAVERFAKHG
ncbi:MAG: CopD family protein [Roseiarcus sp.]